MSDNRNQKTFPGHPTTAEADALLALAQARLARLKSRRDNGGVTAQEQANVLEEVKGYLDELT